MAEAPSKNGNGGNPKVIWLQLVDKSATAAIACFVIYSVLPGITEQSKLLVAQLASSEKSFLAQLEVQETRNQLDLEKSRTLFSDILDGIEEHVVDIEGSISDEFEDLDSDRVAQNLIRKNFQAEAKGTLEEIRGYQESVSGFHDTLEQLVEAQRKIEESNQHILAELKKLKPSG